MLETIGQQLADAREKLGLSIEDVAHRTRIHHDVLSRLESDQHAEFPNFMFVKSFLNIYSQFLELDADETIAQLAVEHGNTHGGQYLLGNINPSIREKYGHLTSRIPVRPIIATAAAIILLSIGGSYLVSHLYGSANDSISSPESAEAVINKSEDPESVPKALPTTPPGGDAKQVGNLNKDLVPKTTVTIPALEGEESSPEIKIGDIPKALKVKPTTEPEVTEESEMDEESDGSAASVEEGSEEEAEIRTPDILGDE